MPALATNSTENAVRDRSSESTWQSVGADSQANRSTAASRRASGSKTRERVEKLLKTEISFITHPSFKTRKRQDTDSSLVQQVEEGGEVLAIQSGTGLPSHLARLCGVELLAPEEERECFRRMNYFKHRANVLRSRLSAKKPDMKVVREAEEVLLKATRLRDHLIRSNTRLVMSIARKYVNVQMTFDELLSHGVVSLMHAIEKFDFGRGFRFSTYATCAIRRDLYRLVMARRKDTQRFSTGSAEALTALTEERESPATRLTEPQWKQLDGAITRMLSELDDREKMIISERFDLAQTGKTLSYSRLGAKLGISKERVRQIANRAMEKLRGMSSELKLEALLD